MSPKEVLLLDALAADAHSWLAERWAVDYQPQLAHDPQALQSRLYKTDALVVPSWMPVSSQLLDFAPRLSVLGRIFPGGDNINLEACRRRGVLVVQAASTTARALSEFLLTSLLMLFRSGGQLQSWPHVTGPNTHRGREINDSVIGLFGLSAPAQLLAPVLQAMGARVVGYDPAVHRNDGHWQRLGVQPVPLVELLQMADGVSLQLPFASRYRGLLGDAFLQQCRSGQLWASVSRLAVFDLPALQQALDAGHIGGLWVDSEPNFTMDGLPAAWQMAPNVRITPRQSVRTHQAYLRGSWYLADRLHQALQSRPDVFAPMTLGGDSVPLALD